MQQAIAGYYAALNRYGGLDVTHETAIRSAMQNLLAEAGREVGWTLIPEYIVRLVGRVITVSLETVRLVGELRDSARP